MCGTSIFQEPGYPAGPGGFVTNFSGERRPRHHHSELEFNLVVSGTACFGVGARIFQLSPGSLLWFLPCQDHLMHWASPDFQMWIVAVKLGLLETELGTRVLADLLLIRDQCRQLEIYLARPVLERCTKAFEAGIGALREEHLLNIIDLAQGAYALAPATRRPLSHPAVSRAMRLLNVDAGLGRSALATEVGLHPSVLSRHFQGEVGVPLVEYRSRIRVARFVEQLDTGERNLVRAARTAGFGSYPQFHRVIREQTGYCPSEYASESVRATAWRRIAPGSRA